MIRFLILCTVFGLTYCSFLILAQFDSNLTITLNDYFIETTSFALLTLLIILVSVLIIILKSVFYIFRIPTIIKQKLYERKNKKAYYSMVQAMAELLIGNKSKSHNAVKNLQSTLSIEFTEFFNLIFAEIEDDNDKKIQYLRELIKSKDYSYFATKKLAQILYASSLYQQSMHYANLIFNINESDIEIIDILINCYAKLSLWEKFISITSKRSIIDDKKFSYLRNQISEYYILAAKEILEHGEDKEAMRYLELAIEYNLASIEAIDLYCALDLSLNGSIKNLDIIETAIANNPSFELMEIYAKSANLTSIRIYEKLEILANPKKHLGLFLAIAAYLDLPEKINELKSSQKLLFYSN